MSTYQFFIILHGLKDVLVWLVPLLIAILLCATAAIIAFRWIHAGRSSTEGIAALSTKVEEIELRLAALEERVRSDGAPDVRDSGAASE